MAEILPILSDVGPTKIVKFMTNGAGVLVQRRYHISHVVQMHHLFQLFFKYEPY